MYLFDASSLILANRHDFPIGKDPGTFWDFLEEMGNQKQLLIPEAVFNEIERGDDILSDWLSARKHIFLIPMADALTNIGQVLKKYGPMTDIDLEELNGKADPYIIAHAMALNAIVVTGEISRPSATNSLKKKIPDICTCFNVLCITYPRFLWEMKP